MSKIVVSCSTVALAGLFLAVLPFGGVARDRAALHFTYITTGRGHAAAVMEAGARQAAADLGVTLGYESLRSVDPTRVAERIAAAAAARPDGLVIAIDDIGPLDTPIEAAATMGIRIVTVGPQGDAARSPGVLMHVDTDDTLAGIAAGRQLSVLGVTNVLCLKVDVDDPADGSMLRCGHRTRGGRRPHGRAHRDRPSG
jgi:ABC-type sugar transport system substrate-binding protein